MRFSILLLALFTALVIAMPATEPEQVIKLLKVRQYLNTSSTEQAKLLKGRQSQNTSSTEQVKLLKSRQSQNTSTTSLGG